MSMFSSGDCLFEVEIPEDLIDAVEAKASAMGISVSELVRRAIKETLDKGAK